MTRYLVVAHQTVGSPELLRRIDELAASDPQASFTLLIPVAPPPGWLVYEKARIKALALRAGVEARLKLEDLGVSVAAVKSGDMSPLLAIEDELQANPGAYDAVVLSTLPPGLSRWLRLDLHRHVQRKFGLPVVHVFASAQRPEWSSNVA